MSIEEYISDLGTLTKNLIQAGDLKVFVEKYKVRGIVGGGLLATKDKDVYNQTERVIKQWIRNEKLYEQFLFSNDNDDQEVVKQLLLHPQVHMRSLLAECIDQHAYEIGLFLQTNSTNQLYQTYLYVLIHLLSDTETEVALRILRALKKMMKMENNLSFMEDNFWLSKVQQGIEGADEVVALRFMELTVSMSNTNQTIHNKIVEAGLLDKAIELYQTDDLLVKLNAVEIFSLFGEKQYNSKYLSEHKITKQIIQEAFDQKEELYIRKYAVILVVKMIGNSVMKLTAQISKDILNFLKQLILSNSQEEISSAFEIISYLCIKQEGVNVLISDRQILAAFLDYTTSTRVELRKKCINAFTQIMLTSPQNAKDNNIIVNLFSCFGNSSLANTFNDFGSDPQDQSAIQSSIKYLEENLFSPFEDIELDYMYLLYQCFQYDEIFFQYIQTQKSVEYMANYICKNKLIFDMKGKLKERLVSVCKANSKNNKLYETFLDTYYKAVQNKTTNNNSSNEMQYETSTL